MAPMPENAFPEKANPPTPAQVAAALGGMMSVWNEFLRFIHEQHSPIVEEWKFMKSGWALMPQCKGRTVCYLFPEHDRFTIAFVLGEKAVTAALQGKLPKRMVDEIESARPYAEGRGFRLQVTTARDLPHLQKLVTMKMAY